MIATVLLASILLVITEGGQVSVQKGLTDTECETARKAILVHKPRCTPVPNNPACPGARCCVYSTSPSDIKSAECIK